MGKPRKTWAYVLLGAIPACALIGLTVYVMSKALGDMGVSDGGKRYTEICVSRLGKVAQAQLLYAGDHDDRLPPAEHWVDATWPYGPPIGRDKKAKDPEDVVETVFRCPSVSMRREGEYGYAFNLDLDAKPLGEVPDTKGTPLVFDSKALFRNAAGPPVAAYPVGGRHNGGKDIVVAYLDGQARVAKR